MKISDLIVSVLNQFDHSETYKDISIFELSKVNEMIQEIIKTSEKGVELVIEKKI